MAAAGHLVKVFVKSSNTTPTDPTDLVDGINDMTMSNGAEMLDITDFKDTSAAKLRMKGLEDPSVSIAGDYESGDAPQALIRSSFDSGADIWVTIHADPSASSGSKGYQYPMKVEKYEFKASVGGKVEFSASFVCNGAKVAV